MWEEIGMWILVLTVIFILGQVWFQLVEGILARIKFLMNRHKGSVWHTIEEPNDENKQ